MTDLQKTPLHDCWVERGAKMVPFAGWSMPVQFSAGVMKEHTHTREAASLFDVSHMGQILVTGESLEAVAAALETVTPASVAGLKPWRQRYGIFTTDAGGIIDDFMFANHETHFYLVANASRVAEDLEVLRSVDGIEAELLTDRALIALQGPEAERVLEALVPGGADMVFMDSHKLAWDGTEVWVSRSGYTGEDGFEVSVPADRAVEFVEKLLTDDAVEPAGLGSRDSLRLEAGMPLYGNDLSEDITPLEAGIGFAVPKVRRPGGSREGGYPGANALAEQLASGPSKERVGLRPEGRAPIREGVEIFADEQADSPIATVTSGGFGPTIGGPIATAMLPAEISPGTTVYAELRGKRVPIVVAELPFVPHKYKR